MALQYADGKPKFDTYNRSGEKIDIDGVDLKGANVTAILVLQNIWVAGGNMFGVSVKAAQLLVEPRVTGFAGCAFRNKAFVPRTELPTPSADLLEDSDSDDGSDVEPGDV